MLQKYVISHPNVHGTFVPKNFIVIHFTSLQNKITSHKSRQFAPHHYLLTFNPHLNSLACNYILTPLSKCVILQGKDASKPAGNWFRLLIVRFTKEYWQGIDYKLPEDDTIMSKHVGV
jgi:hypothetical protein